ncbi:MAG: hypothetical protein P8J87_20780, partial [Verrucomicrobiales bacterium]|nr:hypothetical protein [Verrucomicrobiales bacterium]
SAVMFIHELTRNTAPVIRGMDELASEYEILGFQSFTVMLSGDRTAGEEQLGRVNGSLKLANPMVLSVDGLEGPGNWALNRRAAVTVVFGKDGKVVRSEGLTDTGPNDVRRLRGWIEEVAGKVPGDEVELRKLLAGRLPEGEVEVRALAVERALEVRRLKQQLAEARKRAQGAMRGRPAAGREGVREMRKEGEKEAPKPAVKREGKPPEDGKLNGLLRSFIRQTNDDVRCDEVFAEIETRAGESEALRGEVVEMFKLMLSFRDRYGTAYAQGLAEGFLKNAAE